MGAKIIPTDLDETGRISLENVLSDLAYKGITRLMLECGPILATNFLSNNLVDEIFWFRSPSIIGGDGKAVIGPLNLIKLKDCMLFDHKLTEVIGEDTLSIFCRKN